MNQIKCKDCNRKLTAKLSIKRERGPTCYNKWLKKNTNTMISINWTVIANLVNTIRDKISSKTLEILTVLKHNPTLINVIKESNDIIDRIIKPIVSIMNPTKNTEMIKFAQN